MRGWRIGVRASRSADPTSVMLSNVSCISQTRERNCWKYGAKFHFLLESLTYYFESIAGSLAEITNGGGHSVRRTILSLCLPLTGQSYNRSLCCFPSFHQSIALPNKRYCLDLYHWTYPILVSRNPVCSERDLCASSCRRNTVFCRIGYDVRGIRSVQR